MIELDSIIHYVNDEIEQLCKFVASIDVCYTYHYRDVRFKPSCYNWHCSGSISNKDVRQIEGYNIWLVFFCDYTGINTLIYYPKKVKKGESISVIFEGAKIKGIANWIHGEKGLFDYSIIPLLFIEKLPLLTENLKDNINSIRGFCEYEDTESINELLKLTKSVQINQTNE